MTMAKVYNSFGCPIFYGTLDELDRFLLTPTDRVEIIEGE